MAARYLKFKPQDGILAVARGRVDVYEARGEYQLLVEWLEPQGHGALQFAFDQLKQKLAAEGLFDSSRKKPLPKLPARIGLVTSPSGAVIQDILQILSRRFPGLHIRLYPAPVQGEGSVEAVCRALRYFSESGWAEVVILARGGGSLEDLWTFNEEVVARTIATSNVPVISAVGHETDFTIADFVADLRAATPSAAAEIVICTRDQLLERIFGCQRALERAVRYRVSIAGRKLHELGVDRATTVLQRGVGRSLQRVDELDNVARDSIRRRLRMEHDRLHDLRARLQRMDLRLRFADVRRRLGTAINAAGQSMALRLSQADRRLQPLAAQLLQLSPLRVLERGYAIVQDEQGAVVKDARQAVVDSTVSIRLGAGSLKARVTDSVPGRSVEPG
jgi:exodeoxyribonuclease VII large subunit